MNATSQPNAAPNTSASNDRVARRTWLLLLLILVLAASLRLPELTSAPLGGHGDVSWIGLNALDWIDRGVWPFYIREMYSPEFPVVLLNGLLIPITGISFLSQRLITAGTGILFVLFLFPATWWLTVGKPFVFRERAALLASLSGAVSIQAMYLSRIGMESPPFLMALTLMAWFSAWAYHAQDRRGAALRWILAGAAMATAQYVYLPARLLPIMAALWIAHSWWANRERFRANLRGWIVMAGAAFVFTLPAIILFITVPGSFSGRADTGTAITGGWVWAYDTSAEGGLILLTLKKLALTFIGLGIHANGPYTIMGQPILGPLFFIGFIISMGALIRYPRQIAYAWPVLAIPVMLLTDLISGAVAEVHALHQMGILPFVFILSGLGLAHGWDIVTQRILRQTARQAYAAVGLIAVAVLPGILGTYNYLAKVVPAQYSDPQTGVTAEQIDVDMSQYIIAHSDQSYLLPYTEYSRSNFAWLLSQAYRHRRSAIDTGGKLNIPNPPTELIIAVASLPERIRHDGRPSYDDARLWVLLHENTVYLLPPLTADQERGVITAQDTSEPLMDRSGSVIAKFSKLPITPDFFAPRSVIESPLDATFGNELQLKGYSLRSVDLAPGKVMYVTLYWQALKPLSRDYLQAAQIWTDDKQSIAGATDFPYGGAYRARIWRTDEIVPTYHWLVLPQNLPPARYSLAVTVPYLLGGQRLPVSGPHGNSALQAALAPDLRVSPPVPETLPTPAQAVQFGDELTVKGVRINTVNGSDQPSSSDEIAVKPGQVLNIETTWTALKRPTRDYSIFFHIVTTPDTPPLAQADQVLGGSYPTAIWQVGEVVKSSVQVTLPDTLVPGKYQLTMGVYYWQTGERLPLSVDGMVQAADVWSVLDIVLEK